MVNDLVQPRTGDASKELTCTTPKLRWGPQWDLANSLVSHQELVTPRVWTVKVALSSVTPPKLPQRPRWNSNPATIARAQRRKSYPGNGTKTESQGETWASMIGITLLRRAHSLTGYAADSIGSSRITDPTKKKMKNWRKRKTRSPWRG